MHPVLERQLRRAGLHLASLPLAGEPWARFLSRVSQTYADADRERYLHERSLAIASREMSELYENLRRASDAQFTEIAEQAHDVIYMVDMAGNFTFVNAAAEGLSGYARDELVGRHFSVLVAPESVPALLERFRQSMEDGHPTAHPYEVEMVARDGSRIPVEVDSRIITGRTGVAQVLGIGRDVRERRERERLSYLAHHDPLTGLPNRYVLEPMIAEATEAARAGVLSVVAFLDLDNFKLVNDSAGHVAGDEVLVQVAGLLKDALRADDLLVRMGGDEFAVLFRNTNTEAASQVAERLRRAVEGAQIVAGGRHFYLGASIGLADIDGAEDPVMVLARADAAMYLAKQRGRNRTVSSARKDERPANQLVEANHSVARTRAAIKHGRFEVHYQPVVSMDSGLTQHYEALVRLRDADG